MTLHRTQIPWEATGFQVNFREAWLYAGTSYYWVTRSGSPCNCDRHIVKSSPDDWSIGWTRTGGMK